MGFFEDKLNGAWIKYSDYEILGGDMKFIIPTKGAKPKCYSMTEKKDELISHALEAGKAIAHAGSSQEIIEKECLSFVKEFGLLGFVTYMPAQPQMLGEGKIYLGKNADLFGESTMDTEDYLGVFYPFKPKSSEKFSVITGYEPIWDYAFDKNYCELVLWIGATLMSLYKNFQSFTSVGLKKGDDILFDNSGFSFKLRGYKSPAMQWQANSLNSMLEMLLAVSFASEEIPIKQCKRCEKIFYSDNKRSEFCSPRCRNQYNVYKSRSKD